MATKAPDGVAVPSFKLSPFAGHGNWILCAGG
jgi:hypothetical protein